MPIVGCGQAAGTGGAGGTALSVTAPASAISEAPGAAGEDGTANGCGFAPPAPGAGIPGGVGSGGASGGTFTSAGFPQNGVSGGTGLVGIALSRT